MKTIAFFNNKGGVGKTSLVYHDLFSLQGLKNLGPTLREWRQIWSDLLTKAPPDVAVPKGLMQPMGYVVMQHGIRDSRPVKAYQRWMDRIPTVYRQAVLDESITQAPRMETDPYKLALLKHYRSLMPRFVSMRVAMEARKPMFFLKAADGAIGAHIDAVKTCYGDLALGRRIAQQSGIAVD